MQNRFEFPLPLVTVDAVLLTLRDGQLHVALHRRDKAPEEGRLGLPGGVVHLDKDKSTEDTVRRVLRAKTGFTPRYLEQLQVFSGDRRDPRAWSLSVAYLALVPLADLEAAGAGVFHFYAVDALPPLAFDHAEMVAAAVARVRNKSSYSTLPCALLPEKFTLTQLQQTYEAVLRVPLDKSSFRRKLEALGCVLPTDDFQTGVQRPARLYRYEAVMLFDKVLS